MRRRKSVEKGDILQRMLELAARPVNDAVRLAYLAEGAQDEIAALDLGALSEFKRNANGTVEVKLCDRLAILESVLDRLGEEEASGGVPAFLRALEAPALLGDLEGEVSRR